MLKPHITASVLEELVGFSHYPKGHYLVIIHWLQSCSSLHFPVPVSHEVCQHSCVANTEFLQQSAGYELRTKQIWGKKTHNFWSSVASLCPWYWPQNLATNVINVSYVLRLEQPRAEGKLLMLQFSTTLNVKKLSLKLKWSFLCLSLEPLLLELSLGTTE